MCSRVYSQVIYVEDCSLKCQENVQYSKNGQDDIYAKKETTGTDGEFLLNLPNTYKHGEKKFNSYVQPKLPLMLIYLKTKTQNPGRGGGE